MPRGRYKYQDDAEAKAAQKARNRNWHHPYAASVMPWRVFTDDGVVAVFASERDARGFAKARYGDAATVERRKRGWPVGYERKETAA